MSDQNLSTTSNAADVITTSIASTDTSHSRRHIGQDYSLIWLDTDIDETNEDYQNTFEDLRNVMNNINIFINQDECIDFLTELEDTKVFLIVGNTIGQQIIPLIHDVPQLNKVYVFCYNTSLHNGWVQQWTKIKSVHTEIGPICELLKVSTKQYNQDSIALSIIPPNRSDSSRNLDQLEPSFMYTQIFKEILLDMKHDERSIHDFIAYCRRNNCGSSMNIELFEKEYYNKSAIWWYTWPAFTYPMLNYALRTLNTDVIIKMGFFICDLHRQIEQLYQEQLISYGGESFEVYRGQGLSTVDFQKLEEAKGGLMSFNNFLSTSKNSEVSLSYAQSASTKTDTVPILFVISIDPSVSSAPFASVKQTSFFETEAEILFSMHTIFRIVDVQRIDDHSQIYQVELQLTDDDDDELRLLTKCIAEDIKGDTGWKRLGNLLLKIDQLDKAEQLYNALLEQTSNDRDKAHYYNQLSYIKYEQGDMKMSAWYLLKRAEIEKKTFPANHPDLATSNNNIGFIHGNIDASTRQLLFYNTTSNIDTESLLANDFSLTASSNKMGESSNEILFYEKALEIFEKTLRSNHPDLTTSSNNIATVYDDVKESSPILWLNGKILEIRQKFLPSNHPDLAVSYHVIAGIYADMDEHSKAISFYEKALEIHQITLPPNHPHLAASYNNIGMVYRRIDEYSKALLFCEKALEICQKSLPLDHPNLMGSYINIAGIYERMKNYSEAILFYEKALEIKQITLPLNHPDLAASYDRIAELYYNMEQHSKALQFYEKLLEIQQITLPPNHPDLTASYYKIAEVYYKMEQYSKALPFYEKLLEIAEKPLPSNDLDFVSCYHKTAQIYESMEEYSKALLFYEKTLRIVKKTLPPNHLNLAACYNNIGGVYYQMEEYSKALSQFEYSLNILNNSLPTHPNIKTIQDKIDLTREKLTILV